MPQIKREDDPLGFMGFLASAVRITFTAPIGDRYWGEVRHEIAQQLETQLEGRWDLLLGSESLLTDDSAEFALYIEDIDAFNAREALKQYG